MKRGAPVEIEAVVAELAPGGDGVAVCDLGGERRAVFVRGTTVGDRARVAVDLTKRPARGRVLALLEPGPDRVTPPCAAAARCGGCDWMYVSVEAQRRAHAKHVEGALPEAWAPLSIVSHAADAPLAYRSRARLHVQAARGRVVVGMHEAASHDPVEVEACVVLHPTVEAARARIAALLEGARGRGEAQVALGAFGEGGERRPVLDLRWSGEIAAECFARLEREVASGAWAGARITINGANRPATIGDATPWMLGADDEPLRLAPGGFAQASEAMNRTLARRVAELAQDALGDAPNAKIVELFAGAGNLTVLLAKLGAVVAVESSKPACEAARANLAARKLDAKVLEADASTYAWPGGARLVVLDPPRTGAREVAARLVSSPVRHVIYVSCDPQTLGRDLAVLATAGYAPRAVETFEMFPQTSHVEAVVALERRRA